MKELLNYTDPYSRLYKGLAKLREIFHREGRLNDANEKLDETVKILAIHYAYLSGNLDEYYYNKLSDHKSFSVELLREAFLDIATRHPFLTGEGESIFGKKPEIMFENGDEKIAFELFNTLRSSLNTKINQYTALDVLNEAFGHHVRDNFRNHIEDAQYMTPNEVVSFMSKCAWSLLNDKGYFNNLDEFIMMDPSCGVGSFLNEWGDLYNIKKEQIDGLPKLKLIGQDKIARMVRLSTINMIFSGYSGSDIHTGNALKDNSPVSLWDEKVDLILTNPPFGAKYSLHDLRKESVQSAPVFANSNLKNNYIDSELLFIDRYLSLLKPGGLCLAIVPDSVISSKGIEAFMRQKMLSKANVRGIVELPPVTFAQAGTRTRTAVLMLEKKLSYEQNNKYVFFGETHDLGFTVTNRKGVPIKNYKGHNQLNDIADSFINNYSSDEDSNNNKILAKWRSPELSKCNSWTPRQFAINSEEILHEMGVEFDQTYPLASLVDPLTKRPQMKWSQGKVFISVLHIIGEGLYDINGIYSHQPITPGYPVYPGEIIISRINPRIPRIMVVPDLGYDILCSSEFEILRTKNNISPYALCYLLLSEPVQKQIQNLTSGTSASHARVKQKDLYNIIIPWPSIHNRSKFNNLVSEYEYHIKSVVNSLLFLHNLRETTPTLN
jgi:type I restriction-modification system DNA methylase subunit